MWSGRSWTWGRGLGVVVESLMSSSRVHTNIPVSFCHMPRCPADKCDRARAEIFPGEMRQHIRQSQFLSLRLGLASVGRLLPHLPHMPDSLLPLVLQKAHQRRIPLSCLSSAASQSPFNLLPLGSLSFIGSLKHRIRKPVKEL